VGGSKVETDNVIAPNITLIFVHKIFVAIKALEATNVARKHVIHNSCIILVLMLILNP
jgi:hypothetical protein